MALMLLLIVLHSVDGRSVEINPSQVTSMRGAKDDTHNKLFTHGARCLVNLTDGKFVVVVEQCEKVQTMMEGK